MTVTDVVGPRAVTAVSPSTTVIVPATTVRGALDFGLEVINDDGADTVTVSVERCVNATAPTTIVDTLTIGPGANDYKTYGCDGLDSIRVSAISTGGGSSCRVSCLVRRGHGSIGIS